MANKGLGRGLDMLIPKSRAAAKPAPTEGVANKNNKEETEQKKKSATSPEKITKKSADNSSSVNTAEKTTEKFADNLSSVDKPGKAADNSAPEKASEKTSGKSVDNSVPEKASEKTSEKSAEKKSETKAKSSEIKEDNEPIAEMPEEIAAENAHTQDVDSSDGKNVVFLRISRVEPNREQPRKQFDETALQELSDSIKKYGVIQPIVVCKKDDYYELIAGERRWRAAKKAGLSEIPAIIREYSERERTEVSLIENIQREDLNPMEEAAAYKQLIDEYGLTQEQLAETLSKSRTAVTNTMRLLKLGGDVQKMVLDGRLSGGHARALLAIDDQKIQLEAAEKIIKENLTVRQTEDMVKEFGRQAKPAVKKKTKSADLAEYRDLETRMAEIFGTKVRIQQKDKGKGKIEINYFSEDDLDRIYTMINGFGR